MSEQASGAVLFARYAYPPNQLGYCGPGDGRELLEAASGLAAGAGQEAGEGREAASGLAVGEGREAEMAARARCFDGAWPYLELIAAAAGLDDPLDCRVVEAYWVGNELLDAVDPAALARFARHHFGTQAGADWGCLDAPSAAAPHHSFHVLAIYPWMGLLRRGGPGPALTVLDRCRIRWGRVVGPAGADRVEVRGRHLTWDGHRLGLGDEQVETARWADAGRSLAARPAAGEWVALHWDWVCDRLTPTQRHALEQATLRQLDVTNRADGIAKLCAPGDLSGPQVHKVLRPSGSSPGERPIGDHRPPPGTGPRT